MFPIKFSDDRKYLFVSLLTGICSALVAWSLHLVVDFGSNLLGTNKAFELYTWLIGILLITLSGYITLYFIRSTSGSGIPYVKIAIAAYKGRLTIFQSIFKYFTTVLNLACGMSLGREGPTVMVAGGIGSYFGKVFNLPVNRIRNLVALGCAGGLAAAFNTPIAAVIFTFEEIIGDINARAIGSIILVAFVASVTGIFLSGNHYLFNVYAYNAVSPFEYFNFVILAIVAAFAGELFTRSVVSLRKFNRRTFHKMPILTYIIIFCLMGLASYFEPSLLGDGVGTINQILASVHDMALPLILLLGLKILATSLCYSAGMSGGLFMPTLFLGAVLGAIVGIIGQSLRPEEISPIGLYAMIGMGAYFVAVIRAPFTSVLIIFELTHNYKIVLPLMVANTVSFFIAQKLSHGSIYEKMAALEGIDLPNAEDDLGLEHAKVEDAMVSEVLSLDVSQSVEEAFETMKRVKHRVLPVVEDGRKLIGMISYHQLKKAAEADKSVEDHQYFLENLCHREVFTVYPDQSLLYAFHKLKKHDVSRLIVVHRLDRSRVMGIITAEDIVQKFGFHIHHDFIPADLDQTGLPGQPSSDNNEKGDTV